MLKSKANSSHNSNTSTNKQCSGSTSKSSYKGVRLRKSGKWVSEIREPKKPTRIWLGTYPTPEMAAIAYDVAAYALKGTTAELNFPESVSSLPVPNSMAARDIQAAAYSAAAAAGAAVDAWRTGGDPSGGVVVEESEGKSSGDYGQEVEFMDEDLIFDMPNVLMNMAEGMLLSPPRLDVVDDDDDDGNVGNVGNVCCDHSLWNYP